MLSYEVPVQNDVDRDVMGECIRRRLLFCADRRRELTEAYQVEQLIADLSGVA